MRRGAGGAGLGERPRDVARGAGAAVRGGDALDGFERDLAGACAIFGSERFLKKLAVKHITEAIGGDEEFVPSEYDSNHASWPSIWPDVHDELSTRSLFGGNSPKVVLVDDADKFVTENRDRIHDYVSQSKGSGLLVLIVNTWASNTNLYKLIKQF